MLQAAWWSGAGELVPCCRPDPSQAQALTPDAPPRGWLPVGCCLRVVIRDQAVVQAPWLLQREHEELALCAQHRLGSAQRSRACVSLGPSQELAAAGYAPAALHCPERCAGSARQCRAAHSQMASAAPGMLRTAGARRAALRRASAMAGVRRPPGPWPKLAAAPDWATTAQMAPSWGRPVCGSATRTMRPTSSSPCMGLLCWMVACSRQTSSGRQGRDAHAGPAAVQLGSRGRSRFTSKAASTCMW